MTSVPLWSVATPIRNTVEPDRLAPEVVHYSIPALEATGGPLTEPSESIKSAKLQIHGGELLVAKLNPRKSRVLLMPMVASPTVASTEFVAFMPHGADPQFLMYFLQSEASRQFFDANVRSVTRSHQRVEPDVIARTPVPDIPLDEQRRIADFLDTETTRLDRLLALRQRQEALLAEQHDAAMSAAIDEAGEGAVQLRLKHTGARVTVGIVVTPAAWYVDTGGVPAVRGVDVSPGRIRTENLVEISHEGDAEHAKSRLRSGDVVVVRTGKAGAACAVPDSLVGANAIDLLIVRPGARLMPRYLEHLINSEQTRRFVDEFSVGTIQSHFNVGTLGELPIRMLGHRGQSLVVKKLDALDERQRALVQAIASQRKRLAERRQALITAAVTGQFDVTTARGGVS